jgi:uncharacterized protein with HEPN domain
MRERAIFRLEDMKRAIVEIHPLLDTVSFDEMQARPATRAAFERFLEILSEASRHVPDGWKADHADLPWRQIADLGNVLRHAYHRTDALALWRVYEIELAPLEQAIDALLARYGTPPTP